MMWTKTLLGAGAAVTAALLAWVAVPLQRDVGLEALVAERLGQSGVDHAITAVLLNFRGFDTLLEVGVLLLAVLAVHARPATGVDHQLSTTARPANSPLVQWMLPRLLIMAVAVAGYLLWAGAVRAGGAFQGGTILAAAGVLLLVGQASARLPTGRAWRLALTAGLLGFVGFAIGSGLIGPGLLTYPASGAGLLILAIELGMMVSIGACFLHLVGCVHDREGEGDR